MGEGNLLGSSGDLITGFLTLATTSGQTFFNADRNDQSSEISTKARTRHSIAALLIVLVILSILLNLFPEIQNNSMIAAAGILAGAIEIYGFLRGRAGKDEAAACGGDRASGPGQAGSRQEVAGTQTNIAGGVQGPVLSGKFEGPVHTGDQITQNIQPHEKPPVPGQIPAPPGDFTGRTKEIDELLTGFEKGANITGLQGTGGIGKTALALVVAERLKAQFPDGQIFINLLGTSKNPMDVAGAMAHVIRSYLGPDARLPEEPGELSGLYLSVLSGRKALLLLDNAANREQVEPLLPPPGCAVIVTSRNRFALPGLKAKDLDVLPLEDARNLLLEIADRIGSQAEELARLCGCLPIALRNAASVLADRKDLGVAEYLERLQEARNRVELVEASFGLSYDLLSPELRRLWSMLSVFPAGFDREGAAAVWARDQDSAACSLSDLVKWCLVEFDPASGRYRLHDLARDFAASRLQAGEKVAAEERHAEHYRSVLSASNEQYKQGGENLLAGLALFDREWANIQAGWAWAEMNRQGSPAAASLCSFTRFKQLLLHFLHLQDRPSAASLCSYYPNAGVYVLDLRLHPREKIRWLETAVAAAIKIENKEAEGANLGNLGIAYKNLGEPRKAIEYHDQALKISREIGDRRGEGADLGSLGLAYADLGEPRKAIEHYQQALTIAREIGDRRNEGNWLGNLGNAYAALGEPRKAIVYYDQALKISREIGDRRGEGADLGNLGRAYAVLGEPRKAIEYYQQQLKITQEIGDRRGEGNALFNTSLALDGLGKRPEAVKLAKEALQIYEQIESPYAERVLRQLAEWQGYF